MALALLVGTMSAPPQGPDRLFVCTMGKVSNMSAATEAELGLVGAHPLIVLQPDGAIEYAELPPRGLEGARLVRITDPDRILPTRYVGTITDNWPDKIEILTPMLKIKRRMFVTMGSLDPAAGTATASAGIIDDESETIIEGTFFQGKCQLEVAPNLGARYATLKAAAEKGKVQ